MNLICEYIWQFPRSDAVQILAICGKLCNPDEELEPVQRGISVLGRTCCGGSSAFPLEDRYYDIDHTIHAPSAASTIIKAFDRRRTLLKVAGLAKKTSLNGVLELSSVTS